ncbi:MAG: hypothetical protein ABJF11_03755 [Reichenbachiella sp.]|uniref:hypothetical protein n=1 Tax=Reichenbachiella sp. TaxID=2184521 RepID=UPI00326340A5
MLVTRKDIYLIIIGLVGFTLKISAQEGIGIGTESVNTDAILEIDSKTDGLLIPRMTTKQRKAIDVSSGGLMVYDTNFDALFYWDSSPGIWRKMVATESNLNVDLGSYSIDAGSIHAENYELNASGNGPVPKGGIIMWSGSINEIPYGWVLCNGSNGTPDLTDRFIVGAGDNYSIGNTGGDALITNQEMVKHNHGFGTLKTATDGSHRHEIRMGRYDSSYEDASEEDLAPFQTGGYILFKTNNDGIHSHDILGSTADTGGTSIQENRPPYFALAFIMKL